MTPLPTRKSFLLSLFLLAPSLSCHAAPATDDPVTQQLRWGADLLLQEGAPGVALAAIVGEKTYYFQEGSSGRSDLPITNRTIFEIGSNTKTFTTALLGLDVARGEKKLDDRVEQFLPGITLRPWMQPATLGMLATFRASLPSDPPELRGVPLAQRGIDSYTVQDFLGFISTWRPGHRLPAPDRYSNSSVGLLGLCLADGQLDKWYARVKKQITQPLGMVDTSMYVPPQDRARAAKGFKMDGSSAPPWPVFAWGAAGALKSTTADLARYVGAYLGVGPVPADLGKGLRIATEPRFKIADRPFSQALAWYVDSKVINRQKANIVWKAGGTVGFSSALAFSRELGTGVVVLTNRDNKKAPEVARQLVERLATP